MAEGQSRQHAAKAQPRLPPVPASEADTERRIRAPRGQSLVGIDSPDDEELAEPLAPGDGATLVGIDNPDDAEFPPDPQERPGRGAAQSRPRTPQQR